MEGDVNKNISRSLQCPLSLGAVLGLIPIDGVFLGRKIEFRYLHYRSFIAALVAFGLFLHTILIAHNFFREMVYNKNTAGDLVLIFSGVWFYSIGTYFYIFFLTRSKRLCQYFERWREVSAIISPFLLPDRHLRRNVAMVTMLVFLDCIGENIFYHIHAMRVEERGGIGFSEFLHVYFRSNQYAFYFFDYSPTIAIAMLVTNKLATYAWNFADIILIVTCMALKERFMALNRYLESLIEIDEEMEHPIRIRKGIVSWSSIRRSFHLITELLKEANKLLSPLIWLSYATDMFFTCRQLYELFSPRPFQETTLNQVYMVWSLLHLLGRTLAVFLTAAFLNEEAHRLFKVLQYCDPDEFTDDVRRLEMFLGNHVVGITGSGCFTITRSFVLMIISGICTLEVVLLQNAHLTF